MLSAGKWVRNNILYGSREKAALEWRNGHRDIALRLDYDFLDESSIVFDLGGYRGQWASDIYAKYLCNIYVFEPVLAYADFIRERFRHNKKIKVFSFGLGDASGDVLIKISEEGSSAFAKSPDTPIRIEEFMAFVRRESISRIDVMKINIEGGEYALLAHLIKMGYIKNIRALQVQFHDFVADAKEKMEVIRVELAKTHTCDYRYEFHVGGLDEKRK